MKNIHVLPTDKPSRLVLDSINNNLFLTTTKIFPSDIMKFKNIYITSDEEIKEGDWIFDLDTKSIVKADSFKVITSKKSQCWYYKKIILTTDQDLIKDGVQAIDDEFLEWFVKNPSCKWVEVKSWIIDKEWNETYKQFNPIYPQKTKYKIIIPKEEPKQETLEEVAEKYATNHGMMAYVFPEKKESFIEGAKWQSERMYSEEEVLDILYKHTEDLLAGKKLTLEQWFEQFKKK